MPTVAEQLRTAREARNLSINEIADTTKIRGDHLRALEAGDYDVFTAPVYIRGFVRCYATLLKLDVPAVMETLTIELGQTEKFREPPPLSSQHRGALDFIMLQFSQLIWRKGIVALAVVAVVLIIYFLVRMMGGRSETQPKVPPAVYQPTRKQSGETLPLPKSAPAKK